MATHRVRSVLIAATLVFALAPWSAPAAEAATTDSATIAAQQMLYEINLARWNPPEFAAATGAALPADLAARPPLALDRSLSRSAMFKATELRDHRYFAHQSVATGTWPNQLARDFGYPLPSWWSGDANYIESLEAGSVDPRDALMALGNSPSHRRHIFGEGAFAEYTEAGVGWADRGPYWTIHSAHRENPPVYVTGVVFDDRDRDGRLDPGEGIPRVTVTVDGRSTTTNAGGGYSLAISAGTHRITVSGGGLSASISGTFTAGDYNVGADFIDGRRAPVVRAYELCQGREPTILGTDGDDVIIGTPGPDVIAGLAGDDTITGLGGDDIICGGDGRDTIDGGSGDDRIAGGRGGDVVQGRAGNDVIRGDGGNDRLYGGAGDDAVSGGEGKNRLHGGTGTDLLTGGRVSDR